MQLPSIFKKKEIDSKPLEKPSEVSNKPDYKEKVPKVIFKDIELQVAIGQWLEILPSRVITHAGEGISAITHLSSRALILHDGVTKEELNNINYVLGSLLSKIGVPLNETCIISKYNKDEFSFKCHFKSMNDDAKISLRYGNMDFMPEFIIDYENVKRVYEYYTEQENRPRKLELQSFIAENPKNGNKLSSVMSSSNVNFTLKNNDTEMIIKIVIPEIIRAENIKNLIFSTFRLNNDDKLAKYLLDLDFPIAVDEVYKKICELCIDSIDDYPVFNIIVKKKIDKDTSDITDHILIKNGQLSKFILTKNGKKVGIDASGNAVYADDKVSVNKKVNGEFEYRLNMKSVDELSCVSSIEDQLKKTDQEVQEIRLLAKKISGKDI